MNRPDLISEALTRIPLVNHKGEELWPCRSCSVNGPQIRCHKTTTSKDGTKEHLVSKVVPRKRQATYVRNGWTVTPISCEVCNDAGLFVANKARVQ